MLEGRASRAQTAPTPSTRPATTARSRVDRFTRAIEGFAARLSDRAVEQLRQNPHVAYIEADQRVSIDATQSPATWGLDRIDQRNLPLNNAYTYTPTGQGVTAYIIDTGILSTHNEFGGRVGVRLHRHQRRPRHHRLQRPRHPRRRHGRRHDVRRRQAGHPRGPSGCSTAPATAPPPASSPASTGSPATTPPVPAVANMSLGGGVSTRARHRGQQLDRRRRHLRRRGRQREHQRLQRLALAGRRGADRRLDHQHRRPLELLQLRLLPRPVRAGLEHHVGLVHRRHRDQHHLRHLDGHAARRRRRRALPAGQPERLPGHGRQRHHQHRHDRRRDRSPDRLARTGCSTRRSPAAAPRRRPAATCSPTRASSPARPRGARTSGVITNDPAPRRAPARGRRGSTATARRPPTRCRRT